jgi:hypothetical protein
MRRFNKRYNEFLMFGPGDFFMMVTLSGPSNYSQRSDVLIKNAPASSGLSNKIP